MPVDAVYRPATLHQSLGPAFYDVVSAAKFPEQKLRFRNQRWAERVGLGSLTDDEWVAHFARFDPLPDNHPRPLALRYHGHQFGSYNPQLGDGRGFLYAQLFDPQSGRLLDLGTKGSGQTPWSRGGDGRLTLKGGVREVLCTEWLEALGVNSSKSFSLIETGERLMRNDEPSPTRASVLVRLSHSHVRFGTFQRFAAHGHDEPIQQLAAYCLEHYLPEARSGEGSLAVRFLRAVTRRTAELAASYMAAGFVHGVLNTDNMNITGESFDYGPYRFLPHYDPAFTAAYFDHSGLYAYGRQPSAMHWNLMRLAETLTLSEEVEPLKQVLAEFDAIFWAAFFARFLERLGVTSRGVDADSVLFESALAFMEHSKVGYDAFFFDWYGGEVSAPRARARPRNALYEGPLFETFTRALGGYAPSAGERLAHGYFARESPCTLLIDEVEAVWDRIAKHDDWSKFAAKIDEMRDVGSALGASSASSISS